MLKKKSKSSSYWSMVHQQFNHHLMNRLALWSVLGLILVAIIAPFLANSEPIYLNYQGKSYFPLLRKLWPLNQYNLYPELQNVDYGQLKAEGATVLYTIVPYSPNDYDFDAKLAPPSSEHWMGTDGIGRDVLSRMIYGSRVSLSVGFVAVSIYAIIGIFFGSLAGYFGGWVDMLVSRFIEFMICFPTFFFILTLLAIFDPSIFLIMIAIGLTGWTGIARLIRGEFFKIRNQDYITACLSQGMGSGRIMFRHILPNAVAPALVSISFGIASAILIESALSFLGFGVQPPTPSWGQLLSSSRSLTDIGWWLTIFPGLAIFFTITCFNLVGEGLRDAIDPKLKNL